MTLKSNRILTVLFYCLSIALFSGCAYSFSGSSLPPDIKTISITTMPNNSGQGPAFLSQVVTTEFRNYFQRNTSLNMLNRNGDLQLDGQIINYSVTPVAPQQNANGQEIAAKNRLTITVQLKFTNTHDPKQDFDQPYSGFLDFNQDLNVNNISEAEIRNLIETKILAEVFNKTVANW